MKSILLAGLLLSVSLAFSQHKIGTPDVVSYSKNTYNAGTANWSIAQDSSGLVYFANIEGLLSFDGSYWKTYPLPDGSMARCVAIGPDHKIYTGTQNGFGYFSPNKNGRLSFTSLVPLVPAAHRTFSDIWNIAVYNGEVLFRSRTAIFRLHNNNITVYPADAGWLYLGQANGQLIAQDVKKGLLTLAGNTWIPLVEAHALPQGFTITAITPLGKDSTVVATLKHGLYILAHNQLTPFPSGNMHTFINDRILSCSPVNKDWLAIGTQLSGCYIINRQGEIIEHFSRRDGLENNCVLAVLLDKSHNLWLGLDNGIGFMAYNNAIKHIYPEKLNEGAGYSAIIFKQHLYIGTSNGLYTAPIASPTQDLSFANEAFTPVTGTKAPAWGLFTVADHLLMANHEGAFEIRDGTAAPINTSAGYWNFLPLADSGTVLAGNYNGLDVMRYQHHAFTSQGNLPNLNAGAQYMAAEDAHTIWMAHPYRGVFRITLRSNGNAAVQKFTEQDGLPPLTRNYLFKIKGHIVVTTGQGIYAYNAATKRFAPDPYFRQLFGSKPIRYLKEDADGNIWFIAAKNLGVADFSGPQPRIIYFPELNGKMVSNFEHVYPYNKYNILAGAEKGFYHINFEQYKKSRHQLNIQLRSVNAAGQTDSLLFGGYYPEGSQPAPKMAYHFNSFHFEYSSPFYVNQNSVEYSYYLEGFDKSWSAWSRKTEKDYTNLPPGTYTFAVKAKNNLGNSSNVSHYTFTILPPWYRTTWAYVLYALLFAGCLFLAYVWLRKLFIQQRKKHEAAQQHLLYLHQLELEKSEKEIVKLRNEKLELELEYKNSEIASASMHLVQKGELLATIKDEMLRLKKNFHDEKAVKDLKKIFQTLSAETRVDQDWENFAIHFDKIHADFLGVLKAKYPHLSPAELKLCAYLRMNLSSKEIAQLSSISVRGVELARYRLRRKLQLPTETTLFDFLLQFSSAKMEQ